jgi:hypothetical protein
VHRPDAGSGDGDGGGGGAAAAGAQRAESVCVACNGMATLVLMEGGGCYLLGDLEPGRYSFYY